MGEVFISYSSKNRDVAECICEVLEKENISCWIAPRNITPGKEWGEEIVQGIEKSKVLVLVFSQYSNESKQVLREVERAISKGVVVVNFRIEDIVPTHSMEYFLYTNHWVDAYEGDMEGHVQKLAKTLNGIMQGCSVKSSEGNSTNSSNLSMHNSSKGRKNKVCEKWAKRAIGIAVIVVIGFIALNLNAIRIKLEAPAQEVNQTKDTMEQVKPGEITGIVEAQDDKGNGQVEEDEVGKEDGTLVDVSQGETEVLGSLDAKKENSTPVVADGGVSKPEVSEKEVVDKVVENTESVQVTFELGDAIRFGSYEGEAIDWVVIDVDQDGNPLLLTKEIISLKYLDRPSQENEKGNNYWADSTLRAWLNSDARKVSYKDIAADEVANLSNDYIKNTGFLHEFSDVEKNMIKATTYKSVLPQAYTAKKVGGDGVYNFERTTPGKAMFNYDNAYYENLTDKVFLLSVKEVKEYMVDEYLEVKTGVSELAIAADESSWYKDLKSQTGGDYMWWLRTPKATSDTEMCVVGTKGDIIYNEYAKQPGVGVRPAMYITTKEKVVSGTGKEDDPYRIE